MTVTLCIFVGTILINVENVLKEIGTLPQQRNLFCTFPGKRHVDQNPVSLSHAMYVDAHSLFPDRWRCHMASLRQAESDAGVTKFCQNELLRIMVGESAAGKNRLLIIRQEHLHVQIFKGDWGPN